VRANGIATKESLLQVALQLNSFGLNPLPVNTDKSPTVPWTPYCTKPATSDQINKLFKGKNNGRIGFVTGKGSGNVEVIDVDCKYDDTGTLWTELSTAIKEEMPELFGKLPIEKTPSGGYHLFYRCKQIAGNMKLANVENGVSALIETRGQGGFIVCDPSPGYELVQGHFIGIPAITIEERNKILQICRSFNRSKRSTVKKTTKKGNKSVVFETYDRKHNHEDTLKLLEEVGFKVVGEQGGNKAATMVLRPGKSASKFSGYVYHDSGNLIMFSTGTKYFEHEQNYTPSEVYTQIKHNGDYKAAYEALKEQGYNKYTGSDVVKFIKAYIADNLNIKFNELTNDIELNGKPLTDSDFNTIYLQIGEAYKAAVKKGFKGKILTYDIINSDFTNSYNPLSDFLEANQDRHCTGTISELAATITTSTKFIGDDDPGKPFVEFFLTKWLVNMIATALKGTDNPLIVALLGDQGTGKTEFWRRLLPHKLKRYSGEFAIADDKDFFIAMTKHIQILDDELSGKSRVETKALKKITSMKNIYVRKPYGRVQETIKRRCSFCGTGNDLKVLYDLTGNRRIIPIEVLKIDHAAYNAIDKTDVIVEAYQLWVSGWNYRLSGKDVKALNAATTDFEFNELEVELYQEYLMMPDEDGKRSTENKTASEIKNLFETNLKHRVNLVKLGKALTALGFEKQWQKVHGKVIQRYQLHPDSQILRIENEAVTASFRNN